MSLVINNNLMASYAARNLNAHYARLNTSTQRLSSGLRINSAADDAAGLAIRELQRADIATLRQGARNANDAVSLIQTADGALQIIDEKLIRMKELAEQAATGTYDSTQRLLIESEYQAMASEITRIAKATDFNGIHLLNGNLNGPHDGSKLTGKGSMKIHFGTGNDSAEDYYYISIGSATASSLGVGNNANVFLPPPEHTRQYYEQQRNEAGAKAYEATYALKYNDFYTSIYTKLTTGTPPHPGISAQEASVLAAREAQSLADQYAQRDREMTMASMDKMYDDNYPGPYLNAYNAYIAQGMTHAEADAEAVKIASGAAYSSVLASCQQVKNDNSIQSVILPPNVLLPPQNDTGADAFINYVGDLAQQGIYENVYKSLRDHATAQVAFYIAPNTLNAQQVLDIHRACDSEAAAKAQILSGQVKNAMDGVYQSAYAGDGVTTGFNVYRDAAIAAGNPPAVAEKIAAERASRDGWGAMENALGNPFGTLPPGLGGSSMLSPAELNARVSINVSGVGNVTADKTGTAADINAVYGTSIGVGGRDYLNNKHGLLGGDDAMIKAATNLVDNDKKGRWEKPAGATISTQEAAQNALVALNSAIVSKDKIRAHLGALQNRLENTITNLNIQAENLQAAESRISDVDVATEMTEFVRNQILTQSAVAMLAQANSLPKMAMQLIGG